MTKALIIGGGIAGLTAALRLHRLGVDVEVFESAATIRELGVGINLQPNAVKELTNLGLSPALAAIAIPTEELLYFNKHGQEIWREPRGLKAGYLWPQYSIHRGRLQKLLLDAVVARIGAGAVHAGHHLEGFEQTAGSVTARFIDKRTGAGLGKAQGDFLVGADGIHSTVRRHFYPAEGAPRFSGQIMWRGVTDAAPMLRGRSMFMAGHRLQKFVCYPMSAEAERRGASELNWVAEDTIAADTPMPREEWNRAASIEDVAPRFTAWKYRWFDIPATLRAAREIYVFPKVDRDPVPHWAFDRVVLIGDAAHPMHPAGSSGASQAIVDARALGLAVLAEPDPPAALRAFQAARLDEVYGLVRLNRERMGPEWVMILAEERAPQGFADVHQVISAADLERTAADYKQAAGFDPVDVNRLDPRVDIDPRE